MKAIGQLTGQRLQWTQPAALSMRFVLEANGEPAATLQFRNLLGSLASGESADGSWTFKRTGFIKTGVTIRRSGDVADVATFANHSWSGGGTLHLPDGRVLRAGTNLWHSQLAFETEAGEPWLTFKSAGFLHLSSELEIQATAWKMPELPWIVMLGWYLIVMMRMESSAAAAAAG